MTLAVSRVVPCRVSLILRRPFGPPKFRSTTTTVANSFLLTVGKWINAATAVSTVLDNASRAAIARIACAIAGLMCRCPSTEFLVARVMLFSLPAGNLRRPRRLTDHWNTKKAQRRRKTMELVEEDASTDEDSFEDTPQVGVTPGIALLAEISRGLAPELENEAIPTYVVDYLIRNLQVQKASPVLLARYLNWSLADEGNAINYIAHAAKAVAAKLEDGTFLEKKRKAIKSALRQLVNYD
ncbi:hypothetical protein BC832DRAFT_224193 [Gaertneriomyces semiglobifer]|nr:hypothetical protein BC832DRAFT_224193 [Gaertneriomyces semiglobifer]